MLGMIFKFFLQTGEYDFFVQRLRNAAMTMDRQTNLADAYQREAGGARTRHCSQVRPTEGNPVEQPKHSTVKNYRSCQGVKPPSSATFDFEQYVRDKYGLEERQTLYSEDSYRERLDSLISKNKQIIHSQKKKAHHEFSSRGAKQSLYQSQRASPQLKRISQTEAAQYAEEPCSTLLNYRKLCEYGEQFNQSGSSRDNSMDRRYSQLIPRSTTRNIARLHTNSEDVRNYTTSSKKNRDSIDSHSQNEPFRDPQKEVYEPQIINQRELMKQSAQTAIERNIEANTAL